MQLVSRPSLHTLGDQPGVESPNTSNINVINFLRLSFFLIKQSRSTSYILSLFTITPLVITKQQGTAEISVLK